ncbi:MAG: hypothetical protein IKA47_09520 [Oscillospiraceae bacterium]|nr:hypothetical protein [Oscillospiraceae bacterium]
MKRKYPRLLLIAVVSVLLVSALAGTTVAKYVTKQTFTGKVTFSAKLAEEVLLRERTAERQPDGSYKLTTPYVAENTYELLPGMDIPKDPHVVVKGKTDLKAYLFIEIVDKLTEQIGDQNYRPITYTVSSNWLKLQDVTGEHGGTVYVYKGTGEEAAVLGEEFTKDATDRTEEIDILALLDGKTETVRVSQKLNSQLASDDGDILAFYAAMGETAMGADATAVYKAIYGMTP